MLISNSNISYLPEAERLFNEAKKELSPLLSNEEKNERLCELEKRITDLFKQSSPIAENHTFENFSEKFTESYPQFKPLFSDLFLHLHSDLDLIHFYLNTLNSKDDLKSELTNLFEKLPKNDESIRLIIDEIEKRFSGSQEKLKLAYQILVKTFNINSFEKFQKLNHQSNQLLAIEVAKLDAIRPNTYYSYEVVIDIPKYQINDEQVLIEIAKIAAAQNGTRASEFIKNFGIKDKRALIEIAKIAAAQNGAGGSEFIENFGIEDQTALIEIAKVAAAEDGFGTSRYIKNFGIQGEMAAIEIAKIAAAQNGGRTSEYIKNYAIKDQKAFIEIAKIAAAQDGSGTSKNIKDFGIKNEMVLIEIAKIAAAQNGEGTSQFIENFGIKDETALIEIAKVAAAQDGFGTSENIENYGIENKEALIEIAKIAAAQNGGETSECIKNFGIEDQKDLIEIAKIAAFQNGADTSGWIRRYGIKNQEALIEIAKIAAAQNGAGTSYRIQNYDIEDQDTLIAIAKIAAFQNGGGTATMIDKYGIKNEAALIEIAKIAAAQDGSGTSANIKRFGIKDERALIEIAKIAAAQDGSGTFEYISRYEIKDEKILLSIFLIGMSSSQRKAVQSLTSQFSADFLPRLINAFRLLKNEKIDFSKVYEALFAFCISNKWDLPDDFIKNMQEKEQKVQETLFSYLLCFLGHCALEEIEPAQFKLLLDLKLLEATFNYTDPAMRYQLISPMIEIVKNKKERDYFLGILETKSITTKKKNQKQDHPAWARIPLMLLTSLYGQEVSKNICDAQYKIASDTAFKQGKNQHSYVSTLSTLLDKELNYQDKQYLLEKYISKNMTNLHALLAIKDMNKMAYLRKEELEKTTLSKILEQSVQDLVPIKSIDDFDKKFTNYFSNNRVPNFIISYAAKLSADKQSLDCLGKCMDGLLANEYPTMRYDMSKSEHLLKVFSEKPKLFEDWKKGENAPLGKFLVTTDEALKPVDFTALFKEKLIDFKHLEYADAPFLFDFLTSNAIENTLQKIDEQMEFAENKQLLNIQRNCVKLTNKNLSFIEQKEMLGQIKSDLKEVNNSKFNEFENDIKALLNGIVKRNETEENYNKFNIVDTDDYQDLFLCGTEIEGSCQRLNGNGDPNLNKCLMAYVFDGKNRLLAVKDKSGKIIARQIFRILWDGKEPVLFIERIYPNLVDPKLQKALEAFAIERAKSLGLPLLSIDSTKPTYNSPIYSLSTVSSLRYEYSDAGDSHVTTGKYTINSPNRLDLS